MLAPSYLADSGNAFLKDFMDNDVLSVLGFITALSNASILSIFLHLNYLDDEAQFAGTNVRRTLRLSGLSLIVVFLIAFAIVIVKPIAPELIQLSAVLNSFGILCVVFSLSVLRDILITVTKIPTVRAIKKAQQENQRREAGKVTESESEQLGDN
jgi:hypothetical protein